MAGRTHMLAVADAQLRPLGFAVEKSLGSGTYGAVFAARRLRDGLPVAIKVFREFGEDRSRFPHVCKGSGLDCSTAREIFVASTVARTSSFIVPLEEFHVECPHPVAVFRLLEQDLSHAYRHLYRTADLRLVKLIAFQVFHGLADMHAMRFMHRDVKPHNILIDFRESAWEDCHARGLPVPSKPRIPRVVLADLGLARSFADVDAAEARQKTNEVVTLWYRAPEVVLGSVAYGPAIDVWSLGCVLGELARCIPDGCPLLQSTSPTVRPSRNETYERLRLWTGSEDYGQLIRVFAQRGTPTKESWPGAVALPTFPGYHAWPKFPQRKMSWLCPAMDEQGCDLLEKLLVLDPTRRISAMEALAHPFFDEVRDLFPTPYYLLPMPLLSRFARLSTAANAAAAHARSAAAAAADATSAAAAHGGDTTEPEDSDPSSASAGGANGGGAGIGRRRAGIEAEDGTEDSCGSGSTATTEEVTRPTPPVVLRSRSSLLTVPPQMVGRGHQALERTAAAGVARPRDESDGLSHLEPQAHRPRIDRSAPH